MFITFFSALDATGSVVQIIAYTSHPVQLGSSFCNWSLWWTLDSLNLYKHIKYKCYTNDLQISYKYYTNNMLRCSRPHCVLWVPAQPVEMSNLQRQIQKDSHQVIIIIIIVIIIIITIIVEVSADYKKFSYQIFSLKCHLSGLIYHTIPQHYLPTLSLFRDFFAEKLLELLERKCRFEVFGCEFISKVRLKWHQPPFYDTFLFLGELRAGGTWKDLRK